MGGSSIRTGKQILERKGMCAEQIIKSHYESQSECESKSESDNVNPRGAIIR